MKSIPCLKKIVLVYACLLVYSSESWSKDFPLPDDLRQAVEYFYSVSATDQNQTISLPHVKSLLQFTETGKDEAVFFSDNLFNASGAYLDFEVNAGLDHILRYAYSSDIPSHLFSPAAIRLSYWSEKDDQWEKLPGVIRALPNLNRQIIMRGVEYAVTTPDVFSGAYYSYYVRRTIILCRIEDKTVLISLSKQSKPSSVGRKGFFIGEDEEWNYFYSGEKGLTKSGLGWADTYMYDSFSLTIQYQTTSNSTGTKGGIFSWVNAGWAGLNVVKSNHIHNGLIRYVQCFKAVLESPLLPKPDEFIRITDKLDKLSADDLRNNVQEYYVRLFEISKNRTQLEYEDKLSELIQNPDSYSNMTSEEMKAFLLLEYLKHAMDKNVVKEKKILMGNQDDIFQRGG